MEVEKAERGEGSESNSDDSVSSQDHSEEILEAQKQLDNLQTFDAYKSLLVALRSARNDIFAIRAHRQAFANSFPLPPSVWIEWADDELRIASSASDRSFVANEVMRRGINDYMSIPLCTKLMNLQLERFQASECTADEVRATFEELKTSGATYHFTGGAELWRSFSRFLDISNASTEEKNLLIAEMQKVPVQFGKNEKMDSTMFDSAHSLKRPAEIDDLILSCETFEEKLCDVEGSPSAEDGNRRDELKVRYVMYAGFLAKINVKAAMSVWERCITEAFLDSSLWLEYAMFCREHLSNVELQHVLQRASRNVPWDLAVWRRIVWCIKHRCETKLISIETASNELTAVVKAVEKHVYSSTDWNGAMRLSIAIIMCYKELKLPSSIKETVFSTLAYNEEGSTQWGHCKFSMASVCIVEGDIQSATKHMEDVLSRRSSEVHWWLRCATLSMMAKCAADVVRGIFKRGVEELKRREDVEVLGASWNEFETGTLSEGMPSEEIQDLIENRQEVLPRVEVKKKQRHERKYNKEDVLVTKGKRNLQESKKRRKVTGSEKIDTLKTATKSNGAESKPVGSQEIVTHRQSDTNDDTAAEPKKIQYELNTVFINNLPYKATEQDLLEKFGDCGTVKGVRIPKRGDGAGKGIAYIEFEDNESTLAALKLHETPVLGRPIWVRRSKPPKTQRFRRAAPVRRGTARGRSRRGRSGVRLAIDVGGPSLASNEQIEDAVMTDSTPNQDAGAENGIERKSQNDFRAMLLRR